MLNNMLVIGMISGFIYTYSHVLLIMKIITEET